ncbi:MAG: hypothetical protein CL674_08730 [Bdellovibrionaceae bacterium]|nr:hypothetical protein [Pseudobdellovibrionaceae bacterium]|tara:strand:- start:47085 stop:47942 length:858 start_codon:yes stop_codon:yes gene_type:complete
MNLQEVGKTVGKDKKNKKPKKKVMPMEEFDKYYYYHRSVQSTENDVQFFDKVYKELKGKEAQSFREDFCGTHSLSCEWVKLGAKRTAVGIDLDQEPIDYGQKTYFSELNAEQKKRVEIINANVLDEGISSTDIVSASNFSYFIFKERELLKSYFANAYKNCKEDGIFIVDCFGGPKCQEENEEETEHDDFSYFWDQDSYDPVTNYALFHIHFKINGYKKIKKAFTYDWRMWSIPEIREIMKEAGFSKTHVYWEQSDEDGDGNGVFDRVEVGEECEAWIAYIVGER